MKEVAPYLRPLCELAVFAALMALCVIMISGATILEGLLHG